MFLGPIFMSLILVKRLANYTKYDPNFFFWKSFNLLRLLLILTIYHQTKTPIGFWCKISYSTIINFNSWANWNPQNRPFIVTAISFSFLFLYHWIWVLQFTHVDAPSPKFLQCGPNEALISWHGALCSFTIAWASANWDKTIKFGAYVILMIGEMNIYLGPWGNKLDFAIVVNRFGYLKSLFRWLLLIWINIDYHLDL